MLQIKVNGDKIIHTHTKGNLLFIDNSPFDFDIINISENIFHIVKDNISYEAEIIERDFKNKTFKLKINNQSYTLQVKDKNDLILDKLGLGSGINQKVSEIKAPMPGLIVKILVEKDQDVNAGDSLLILEAMKMENIIKSPYKTTIKDILVIKGDIVNKNQILINFK